MVKRFYKAGSPAEALELLARPGAKAIAGGSEMLIYEAREKPEYLVDISSCMPRAVSVSGSSITIGAGATLQELLEAKELPGAIKEAALTMGNRNIRNRATVGGNIAARKSSSSLAPILLALDAQVEYQEKGAALAKESLASWLEKPKGLILNVIAELKPGLRAKTIRLHRTGNDLAIVMASAVYKLENGTVKGLGIAMGGFGHRAEKRPDLAALFEGKALPSKEEIEKSAKPLLKAISDKRGSAKYKEHMGATILADVLFGAEEQK